MNISLFSISQEFIELYNQIERGCGEITTELEQALAINESNLAEKAKNYYFFMKDVEARIEQGKIYMVEKYVTISENIN